MVMSKTSPGASYNSIIDKAFLSNHKHIEHAALQIAKGKVVAIDNYSVWGLWGDASNELFLHEIKKIKSRDSRRPFALTLPFNDIVQYADLSHMHPGLHHLFTSQDTLKNLLGGIAFVRFPIMESSIDDFPFNKKVLSYENSTTPYLQNYDPSGRCDLELLIKKARALGAILPVASSMNISGEHEITSAEDATEFIAKNNISTALYDTNAQRAGYGSYTILKLNKQGFNLHREGNVSNDIISRILHEYPFDVSEDCKRSCGKPFDGFHDLKGAMLRTAILESRSAI